MIVSLTGFMGSGKSSVGRKLSTLLSFPFVDLDEYIEHKIGRSIPEIFSEGEEYFRAVEAEAVRDLVTMRQITGEDLVLALGGGTFTIGPIRDLLLSESVCIHLRTSLETCMARIPDPSSRPLLMASSPESRLAELYASRLPLYTKAEINIDTDGLTISEVASEAASAIASCSRQ